jgi:type IV pilus assembly protein PilA
MTSRLQAKLLAQRALFQRLQSSKKRSKLAHSGFTLVELLIVIVVIGILSAIAIPQFLGQRERAQQRASEASVIGFARSCAAAKLAGTDAPALPTGITPACTPATGTQTFTAAAATFGVAASATANADGTATLSAPPAP